MPSKKSGLPIIRHGFGMKDEIADTLTNEYRSELIQQLRDNESSVRVGDFEILLAKEFGFCYGVDRAVNYAYETRRKYPDTPIYITTEIIHNPRVNRKLREMDIRFLSGGKEKTYDYDDVQPGDIVILPAFGASVEVMERLANIRCTMVDTTCGSVMNVWKRVERNAKDGFTSIIHGKFSHEETIATSSRVLQFPGGRYLIVRNEAEVGYVCDYIRQGGNKNEFLEKFEQAISPNFDPDKDLVFVGLANQTTMLSSEYMAISKMIESAIADRYGLENLKEHYRSFDTICSATQERQDAIVELGKKQPNLILVVGGYNSSNTSHLCEIGLLYAPTYHISDVDCILSSQRIRHKPFGQTEEINTDDWLPDEPVKVGVTSGASTPDKVVEEVILRLLECHGYDPMEVFNDQSIV